MAQGIRFGIFPRLFFSMIVVAVIPMGAIWYVDYRASLDRLTADLDARLSSQADAAVNLVDAWVDMNLKVLRQNAALDDMATMDPKKQRPLLRSVLNEYRSTYLVFTVGLDGMNVARSDDVPLIDYKDRVYVQQVLQGGAMGQQVVISRTTGQPALILSVPITAKDRLAGVLALGASVTEVSGTVANARFGRTGYAFLVDETGAVIAHPLARGSLKDHPALAGLGAERKKKVVFADAGGRLTVAFAQKTRYGWTMLVQQDASEAYAPLAEANRNALILLGITVVFVALVAWVVARRFARPILNLTRITDSISRGSLGAKIGEVSRSDEIGGLARAIDRLSASVKLAMDRLAKK
jgi:methyl-accepting chemotaxis protein